VKSRIKSYEDKDKEKLIIFDDFISLKSKDLVKIQEYLTAGRKFGFTVFLLAQNYVSVPKIHVNQSRVKSIEKGTHLAHESACCIKFKDRSRWC
jgi:hypothetical protein